MCMLAPGAVQPRYLPRELWFHGVRATLLTYGHHAFHPDVKTWLLHYIMPTNGYFLYLLLLYFVFISQEYASA